MSSNDLSGRFEELELENVDCLICSSPKNLPAGFVTSHGVSFHYRICENCGLKYMSPRPTKQWYTAHYSKVFWQYKMENRSWQDKKKKWRLRDVARKSSSGRQRHQAGRLGYLIPVLEKHTNLAENTDMLDIGCAFGAIGKGLSDHFKCRVFGVEPNVDAHAIARNENNIEIIAQQAEELISLSGQDKKYTLILLSNVLENILDPVPILTSLRDMLTDDGVICIHMPNYYYYDAMNPYHPYIYSPDTLTRLCYLAGLNVATMIDKPAVSSLPKGEIKFQKSNLFMTAFAVPDGADKEFPKPNPDILSKNQADSLAAYAKFRDNPFHKFSKTIRRFVR